MKSIIISIALCTYNGEKYLKEQLESILNQTIRPNELIICDDGSSDTTVQILRDFQRNSIIPIYIYLNEYSIGVVKNFSKCVGLCRGKYIALSDQDDVWELNKIECMITKIRSMEESASTETPILVHSDLEVVDQKGQQISPSFFELQHIWHSKENPLKKLLVQNFVTGCTCLMNRKLVDLALPIPHNVIMHDWWFALIAASTGKIGFISKSTIKYRQHDNNTVGAKGFFSKNTLKKIAKWNELNAQILLTVLQTQLLKNHFNSLGINTPNTVVEYLEAMQENRFLKCYKIICSGIRKQGIIRNCLFFIILLFGIHGEKCK